MQHHWRCEMLISFAVGYFMMVMSIQPCWERSWLSFANSYQSYFARCSSRKRAYDYAHDASPLGRNSTTANSNTKISIPSDWSRMTGGIQPPYSGPQFGVLVAMEQGTRIGVRHALRHRQSSIAGSRRGRKAPFATASGIVREYRPCMLIWSWICGDKRATSSMRTSNPSFRSCSRATSM